MLERRLPGRYQSAKPIIGAHPASSPLAQRRYARHLATALTCLIWPIALSSWLWIAGPLRAQVVFTEDPDSHHMLGASAANGAVIWSHGRSLTEEDSKSPTPSYIETFRTLGWDAFRFNRQRDRDSLRAGSRSLAWFAAVLKARGYRTVALAGQSYGAFMSLMAADVSADIDAVVAIAPAAFGPVEDNPTRGALNASRLYPVLDRIRRARVMLFFFKDDIYDPGGRGARSEQILTALPRMHLVVDRPAGLETHWAGGSGKFAARFGPCIVAFASSGRGIPAACNGTSTDRPALTTSRSASAQAGKSDPTPPLSGGSATR
jgi:hypothetical protein